MPLFLKCYFLCLCKKGMNRFFHFYGTESRGLGRVAHSRDLGRAAVPFRDCRPETRGTFAALKNHGRGTPGVLGGPLPGREKGGREVDYGRPLPSSLSAVIRFLRPLPNSCVLRLSVVRDGDVSALPHAKLDALPARSSEQLLQGLYRPPASCLFCCVLSSRT